MSRVVIEFAPLEDELGDVLDKAMLRAELSGDALAGRAGVAPEKIRDAIDYRNELSADEIRRLAASLSLNEAGLLSLAQNRYPLPAIAGLPLCLYPLRNPHGIGVANAYIVADCSSHAGILFDTGASHAALRRVWPKRIQKLDAIFITHAQTEHVGGLAALLDELGPVPVFCPEDSPPLPGVDNPVAAGEAARLRFGKFEVRVLKTPGHAEAHNCYHITVPKLPHSAGLLVSGDLLFAGSAGRGFFCCHRMEESLRRLFDELPDNTVIAPGHGPLTTLENERRFNPFAPR
ncbi:MBL fold metallo-hydrolase [Termitidicoccus mucosus]|uniref:MBL fold metallo-hydrolase n=1 Tax=Termitidicoccus mucosus TaxID=1184151 RepID=UPI002683364C